jgi:hypothetical protein
MIASQYSCNVSNRIHWLFTVQGDQENKTGQETSTSQDIIRNLGKKQRRKSTRFRWTLSKRFSAASLRNEAEEEEALIQLLKIPYQLEPPINHLKRAKVQEVINSLIPKNYDLITGKILKYLHIIGIKYLT